MVQFQENSIINCIQTRTEERKKMTTAKLDSDLCNQLAKHVETLTTSGKHELDTDTLKQLKKICRISDDYVTHTYHLLIHQLETEHAEVRLSALLVCDELFRRSHRFRELLVSDFQTFLELTVETDPEEPLPPPIAIAKKLKRYALDTIEQWHRAYSNGYKKLALGYNFLKDCKKVDFRDVLTRNEGERRRDEEQRIRRENANKEILEKQTQEMSILRLEIDSSLDQMHECFRLLLPKSLQLFSDVDFEDCRPSCSKDTMPSTEDEDEKDWAREHGLVSAGYNLTVQVQHENLDVKVTKDNEVILENLRDLTLTIINRYLPAVSKWTQAIIKGSGPSEQLKKAVDLKNVLDDAIKRCKEFGLDDERKKIKAPSDDEEDDFEEVEPKEGYEPTIPQHLRSEYGLEPLPNKAILISDSSQAAAHKDWNLSMPSTSKKRHLDELHDPTSMVANAKRLEEAITSTDLEMPSTSSGLSYVDKRKAELMAKAPKLRFDADLYNWGEENTEDPSLVIKLDSLHRFWTPFNHDGSEFLRKEDAASRHNRVIEFSGEFKPVEWRCRAPLPSGRLCPRQDRHKCPLHGPIIARDATGNPIDPKDRERLIQEEEDRQRENPDWQEPKLLAEIKAATGVDLTITKRGKKKKKDGKATKKKQKYPGLTDLKAKQSTCRTRLEKKVLNSGSVKRVAATLDALDYKKYTDKYANQFNYACQT